MRRQYAWGLCLLALLIALAACSRSKGPGVEPLTVETASTTLLAYEATLLGQAKYDPADYVTGPEKEWLAQFIQDRDSGKEPMMPWVASGAVFKLEKVTRAEAQMLTQIQENGKYVTFHFKMVPVDGTWKIANHTSDDGQWYTPPKK